MRCSSMRHSGPCPIGFTANPVCCTPPALNGSGGIGTKNQTPPLPLAMSSLVALAYSGALWQLRVICPMATVARYCPRSRERLPVGQAAGLRHTQDRCEGLVTMEVQKADTAVVFIDPQNDVLSVKGA